MSDPPDGADPHAWVIPRLQGRAKAALVAVEFDEFGGGRAERMHSRLFADLLDGAGLRSDYLGYLNDVPAPALAVVNMMSMFGLHRALRGALIGHFAAAEITTAPAAKRMVKALERLNADPACVLFYTEHIDADAVHEQVLRHDVVGDLLEREPELAADVVFGVQATELLEARLGEAESGRAAPETVARVAQGVGAAPAAQAHRHLEPFAHNGFTVGVDQLDRSFDHQWSTAHHTHAAGALTGFGRHGSPPALRRAVRAR